MNTRWADPLTAGDNLDSKITLMGNVFGLGEETKGTEGEDANSTEKGAGGNCAPEYATLFIIILHPARMDDLSFKGRRVADNTHVCSCQRGEIIYSIKSQVHAAKQTV